MQQIIPSNRLRSALSIADLHTDTLSPDLDFESGTLMPDSRIISALIETYNQSIANSLFWSINVTLFVILLIDYNLIKAVRSVSNIFAQR